MNRLSIVLTVSALVAHSLGYPHREHGHQSDFQSAGNIGGHRGGDREFGGGYGPGQGGGIGIGQGGGIGHGHGGGIGHGHEGGISHGHEGGIGHGHEGGIGHGNGGGIGHGQGSGIGHGQGSGIGHGQGSGIGHGKGGLGHGSDFDGGSHNQQQYERNSHGGGSNLNVVSGFSKTRVEEIDSGSQSADGGGSSYGHQQNGGRGFGASGLGGSRGSGFETGNSQFGSQSQGLIVEESSGFTSINKNQGGFRDNERGSSVGSSGGRGSRY